MRVEKVTLAGDIWPLPHGHIGGVTRREGEAYEKFVSPSKANPISRRVKLADLEENMDIRRMNRVTPKNKERLARYRKAWGELRGLKRNFSAAVAIL